MNLIELYDSLSILEEGDERLFNAVPIPEYPNFRIAIDFEGNPVLLLSVTNPVRNVALKNFRLKHLQLNQNIECKITETGKETFQTFTVITFISVDRHLREYFLKISETLIKTIDSRPTQEQVIDTINRFVEVFRALADTPTNTVHGLWSELFVIDNSKDQKTLLNYWHSLPEERFDFNSGQEKIEVKSSAGFERVHTFTSEQLNPAPGTQALIASVFIKQSSLGQTIQYLINNITCKIAYDPELTEKLNTIVCRTLGNSLEQSINIKFDYQIAKDSLQFYRHQDIYKVEPLSIPNGVSEVQYKSDLNGLKPVSHQSIDSPKLLFNAVL